MQETKQAQASKDSLGCETIRWDLSELFSSIDDPKIAKVLADATPLAEKFVKTYRGKLEGLEAPDLAKAYQDLEQLWKPLYQVSQFVHLHDAVDTGNNTVKALVFKVDEAMSHISNMTVFFDLEIGKISPDRLEKICQSSRIKTVFLCLKKDHRNRQIPVVRERRAIGNPERI